MLNFEILEYKRTVESCHNIVLENFKLFHHFKVEPDSIRAEYFENSIYYTNYEVKFTAKTKKPDKVGSKRSLEEVEDKTQYQGAAFHTGKRLSKVGRPTKKEKRDLDGFMES